MKEGDFDPADALERLRHEEVEGLFDFLDHTQFWIKDTAGRYLRVNRAFQLNYSLARASEVIGLTDFDLSPAYLAEQFARDDARVLRGERILGRLELVGRFDRVTGWFRTSKIPVRDREGAIAGTAGITRRLPGVEAAGFPVPELAPALAAMQGDPAANWTNAELAKRVGLSVSAFERKFRRHLQTTPMRFLKRLRLTSAAAALVQTDRSIADIGLAEGFSDQAHFTREFRKGFGLTPRVWRQREADSVAAGGDHDFG
ncbi:MAG: helix-turn-helix domain-containing protein [Verrucomicrobiae bacterium]|nr:helix-turn-helix domain-containing protein [Verrucomicrobiae bacterium]